MWCDTLGLLKLQRVSLSFCLILFRSSTASCSLATIRHRRYSGWEVNATKHRDGLHWSTSRYLHYASEACTTFTNFTSTTLDAQLVNYHDFRIFGYPEERREEDIRKKGEHELREQTGRQIEARDKRLCRLPWTGSMPWPTFLRLGNHSMGKNAGRSH